MSNTTIFVEPPDDFVPVNNEQLASVYGGYIARLVARLNRVKSNQEDLLQHVWEELIKVGVIEKHATSVVLPKTMTAMEAANFLGVSWGQWKVECWRHSRGAPTGSGRKVAKSWFPTPISGTWASKNAVYRTEDIETLDDDDHFRKYHHSKILPRGKCHFKSYLTRAVHNIYANYCRKAFRRHKERPVVPMEDGSSWESHLMDPLGGGMEVHAELSLARDQIEEYCEGEVTLKGEDDVDVTMSQGDALFQLIADGMAVSKAAEQVGMPRQLRLKLLQALSEG